MSRISHKGDALILEYDLFSLPTAQHKAGLAGLLLHLDSLRQRQISPIPRATVTAASAEIEITRESLQTLFDDLYDAEWREVEVKQKWKDKEPKRIEFKEIEVNGKKKTEKRFVYDAVQPKGRFIKDLFGDDTWVKIWRDMLWSILRGIPLTRGVYEQRANENPSSLGADLWQRLLKALSLQEKGTALTDSMSSAIFVGAEDVNAEKIPFQGLVAENLILHFWPLVSLIFVPRVFKLEKTREQGLKISRQEKGYVLAIPDPLNLRDFCQDFKDIARSLDPAVAGFRPKAALIDLAEEGGLEYLYHFARHRIQGTDMSLSLAAVELYHLQRAGNRIRQLAAERLLPRQNVLRDYEKFRGGYANFQYKSLYLRNLLVGEPWYQGADDIFSRHPLPLFIYLRDKTPREVRFFGSDVRKKLEAIAYDLQLKQEGELMGDREQDDQLALRVNRLIQEYVNRRTEEKSGKKFKDFKQNKDKQNRIIYPNEYREARGKVCTDAFLALRSRRDQDFIDYFTGTICSVPQFLPEADFLMVSQALTSDWPRVKTLAMLALSAHSYLTETSEKEEVTKS